MLFASRFVVLSGRKCHTGKTISYYIMQQYGTKHNSLLSYFGFTDFTLTNDFGLLW